MLLVEKPPGAAELDFSRRSVLKTASDRRKQEVVGWIVVVENHPRQRIFSREKIKIRRERRTLRNISHGVITGVGPDGVSGSGVDVAPGAEVKLLGPSLFRIEPREEEHHIGCKLYALFCGEPRPFMRLHDDRRGSPVAAWSREAMVQSVVREPAAEGMEFVVALAQGVEERLQVVDFDVGRFGKLLQPGAEF